MSYDKESPAPVGPPIPGVEWVNLVTSHDHNVRNVDGAYFCEIHLQINLSREGFDELNGILGVAVDAEGLPGKLAKVKALLKQELVDAGRNNESTGAMVEAIRLR